MADSSAAGLSIWWEVAKALPSVVTAGTAIWGLSIARAGLTKWRSETIGKRKAELAEQVLAGFYEARDLLEHIRSPVGWGNEGESRTRFENETDGDKRLLDAYFTPVERIRKGSEFFAQFAAHRYRFMALFGSKAAEPYDEIFKIRSQVAFAAKELMDMHRMGTDRREDHADLKRDWIAMIGWGLQADDKIRPRIEEAISSMERSCRPAIEEYAKK